MCWYESRWATARSYMACPAGTTTWENHRSLKKGIELIPKGRDCTTAPSTSLCECLHQILTFLPAPFLAHGSCTLRCSVSQAKLEGVGHFSFLLPRNVTAAVQDMAGRVMTLFYCKSQLGTGLPCLKQLLSYYTSSGLPQAVFLALCSA